MGRRAGALVACLLLVVGACSTTSEDPNASTDPPSATTTTVAPDTTATTTTTTDGSPSSSTSTTTTDAEQTTPTHPSSGNLAFEPSDPWVAPEPTDEGGGSGCRPGSGPLPDGVWFGFLDGIGERSIDFDLACYLACYSGVGYQVANTTTRQRAVPVGAGAIAVFDSFTETVESIVSYEDIGLHNEVWVYVNDGVVTHIVFPPTARGCRADSVAVEWIARLPAATTVAFGARGLLAVDPGGDEHPLYDPNTWVVSTTLSGSPGADWWRPDVSSTGGMAAIGGTVHRWTGSGWETTVLPEGRSAIAVSADRVLVAVEPTGSTVGVEVHTWTGSGWAVHEVPLGSPETWETWSGAISGDRFAVADTGLHTAGGRGVVRIFEWDGSAWTPTVDLRSDWDTGMFGSWTDLEGDRLVVGADGATPGPGTYGGVYLFVERDGTWESEVVGEDGEGFGFGASIGRDMIVTSAGHSDTSATFWVFTIADPGWVGTPIQIDELDPDDDWVYGIDLRGDLVAVSVRQGIWVGRIFPIG